MSESEEAMNCRAEQMSDQMVCACGNVWDVNDTSPPECWELPTITPAPTLTDDADRPTSAATGDINAFETQVGRSQYDPVTRPVHYQSDEGIEAIDAIRAALGLEGFVAHCRGTALKYAFRAGKKGNAAECLRKGAWYLERAAKELEK